GFRIMRVVRGRDSFNPMLYGRFQTSPEGTRVRVVMTFHPIMWLFILGWSSYFMYLLTTDLRLHASLSTGALIMLLAIWAMALPFFYSNAARSRELLEKCLDADGVRLSGRGHR